MKKLTSAFSVKLISIIVLIAMIFGTMAIALPARSAKAGLTSSFMLESAGFNGALSKGTFSYDSGDDISIDEDNIIYFGMNDGITRSTANLVTKARLNKLTDIGSDFIEVDLALTITDIPANGEFVFALALPSRNSLIGEAGSLEFVFKKSSDTYALTVQEVTSSGKTIVSADKNVGSSVNLTIDINLDKTVSIVEDGVLIVNSASISNIPEGYVGFGYRGAECKVAMNNVVVVVADYDKPTNPGTIVEKFNNNEFNANLWWSEAKPGVKAPSFCHVENNYLRISNAHKPHFTTLYQYSNLSLEFELFDFMGYEEDEEGNVLSYAGESLTIYFGCANYTEDIYTSIVSNNTTRVNIGTIASGQGRNVAEVSNTISVTNFGSSQTFTMGDVNPCDVNKHQDRRVCVKIEIVDLNLKVWMKYLEQGSYGDPIADVTLRDQPTGYVRFGCYGDTQIDAVGGWARTLIPGYSIDNITLSNLDVDPENCEMPPFKSNIYDTGSDWPYVNTDRNSDLLGNRVSVDTGEQGGCNSSIGGGVALLAPAIAGSAIVIYRRKKRNEKN